MVNSNRIGIINTKATITSMAMDITTKTTSTIRIISITKAVGNSIKTSTMVGITSSMETTIDTNKTMDNSNQMVATIK